MEIIQHYQRDHGIVSTAGLITVIVIGSHLCNVSARLFNAQKMKKYTHSKSVRESNIFLKSSSGKDST